MFTNDEENKNNHSKEAKYEKFYEKFIRTAGEAIKLLGDWVQLKLLFGVRSKHCYQWREIWNTILPIGDI